jgi:hypothetical protein
VITYENAGWRVSRRIGVGDRELVRAGLLQVALMSKDKTIPQIEACLAAVKKLQKTLRIYVNCTRLSSTDSVQRIISQTFAQHRDHDFMEEYTITPDRFKWVLGRSDMVIIKVSDDDDLKYLPDLILRAWNDNGGRHNLNEQTWRQTEEFCRQKFPEYYAEDEALWHLWSAR